MILLAPHYVGTLSEKVAVCMIYARVRGCVNRGLSRLVKTPIGVFVSASWGEREGGGGGSNFDKTVTIDNQATAVYLN